ncbi:gephyrin [Tieghemostelium lacteum]|uniref:Gephyrin n=1 Tax=Tieghemostelium lacteum TaxID=361077 RepID=A0A151ZK99_TIELA|nr:gephyrin [Tieghemostelium lacteum]|eukprot:KYQ94376.1 gephyrin [Tieghemostelium lacteum]
MNNLLNFLTSFSDNTNSNNNNNINNTTTPTNNMSSTIQNTEDNVSSSVNKINEFQVGILTISDRVSRGKATDQSGPEIINILKNQYKPLLSENDRFITVYKVVPDSIASIQGMVTQWTQLKFKLIITTGGTGFSPRDLTPEAIKPLLDKRAKGIDIAMLKSSLDVTPHAMLSRPCSGIRDKTLIVTLPGSVKAVRENLVTILPALPHAIDLICQEQVPDQSHLISNQPHLTTQQQELPTHHGGGNGGHSHSHGHGHVCGGSGKNKENESKYEMVAVNNAIETILKECEDLGIGEEQVETMNSFGRIIGQDVHSDIDFPQFRASIKDGYALNAKDGLGKYKVLGDSFAGSPINTTNENQSETNTEKYCVKITTGARVPEGYDSVIQIEDTKTLTENYIEVLSVVSSGQDIRPVGSDISKGSKVLSKGDKIGSSEIGLLATLGIRNLMVFKLPTITVLSTGNELVPFEDEIDSNNNKGTIRDTNSPTLQTLIRDVNNQFGQCCQLKGGKESFKIIPDNYDSLRDAIENTQSDIIITSGGVSMGELDLVKPLLEKIGKVHIGRVNMKPGKPLTFSTVTNKQTQKKTLVFSLPGNPVSSVVCFYVFVLPALRKLSGFTQFSLPMVEAKLSDRIPLDLQRPEYHRSQLTWDFQQQCFTAKSTGSQASCRMLSLSRSNCFLILPAGTPNQKYLEKNTIVKCLIISNIYS